MANACVSDIASGGFSTMAENVPLASGQKVTDGMGLPPAFLGMSQSHGLRIHPNHRFVCLKLRSLELLLELLALGALSFGLLLQVGNGAAEVPFIPRGVHGKQQQCRDARP